ncbi:MAG: 50S ribosomal protein L29 [Deltaproteobacteria bacterium]|nr:50S ribosomal protein L29 [Deltaproteobacteria bacterium]MBW2219630.1 50S ribosomal protein L29 [Deltaproteobacteria bacterium]
MKAGEIREMSPDEMKRKKDSLKESYFNLRFQNATGQLENTGTLLKTRRDIARIETVIKEQQSMQTDQE